jgi:hypothetical protein
MRATRCCFRSRATPFLIGLFGLPGLAIAIIEAGKHVSMGGFLFTVTRFFAYAASNHLGRPGRSALVTWHKNALPGWPLASLLACGF